jgi:hypothetical protein
LPIKISVHDEEGGMADGDKVHGKLPRRYQKLYKQICEGLYSDAELAHEALRPLKQDLSNYRDEPLTLIQQVASELSQIPAEPLLKQSVDWGEKSRRIERGAQQMDGHPRGMDLAVQACKQQLQELRGGSCPHDFTKDDLARERYKKYISAVYEANFAGRVPLAQHYNGADQATVDARLKGMRTHVEPGIEIFAAQMMRNGSTTLLRRPPMTRRPINIDDDLLSR